MTVRALSDDADDIEMIHGTRAVLELLAGKWSVDVLDLLATGTRRYSEVFYGVGEISKRTRTQGRRDVVSARRCTARWWGRPRGS